MPRTLKDVEAYLLRSHRKFSAVDDQPGTFLVEPNGGQTHIAVRVDPPIVVCRVHIGDLGASKNKEPLFRRLLQLNAKSMHASYGIEDDRIILSAALELENLDFNELEATLDELDVALAQQIPELAKLTKA